MFVPNLPDVPSAGTPGKAWGANRGWKANANSRKTTQPTGRGWLCRESFLFALGAGLGAGSSARAGTGGGEALAFA